MTITDTGRVDGRFLPLSSEYLADPYPRLKQARETAAAFYAPDIGHWVITRYRDIHAIFRTPASFSAINANEPLTPPCPMAAAALKNGGFGAVRALANADPPAHTRARRLANVAFTIKRTAEMEPFIRELTVGFCKERLRDGRADLVGDLAWELPALVLFRILGIPDRDVPRVKAGSWSRILFVYGRADEAQQVEAAEGMAAFWRYAESVVNARNVEPQNDFISDLIRARDPSGDHLTLTEVTTIALNLLFAGHETTTGMLGNTFRRLLEDRNAWNAICADPALIPNAVEEGLRLDSSVVAWRRRTTTNVVVGGVPIPSGANVLLMLASANRDPDVFPDPDRLDIRRPNAREHLSFGHGPHRCLGAPLARLQGRLVLEEVSTRLPGLRLVPDTSLEFAPNISFRGPLSLPVMW